MGNAALGNNEPNRRAMKTTGPGEDPSHLSPGPVVFPAVLFGPLLSSGEFTVAVLSGKLSAT